MIVALFNRKSDVGKTTLALDPVGGWSAPTIAGRCHRCRPERGKRELLARLVETASQRGLDETLRSHRPHPWRAAS